MSASEGLARARRPAKPALRTAPDRGASGPDLRLLPATVGVWSGLLCVLLAMPTDALVVGLVGLTVGLGAGVGAGRVRSRRPGVPRWQPGLAIAAAAGLGIALGSLHVARLHPELLDAAAREGAVLRVDARVIGDPVEHLPTPDGGRPMPASWTVRARLERVDVRSRAYSVRAPVVLRGDAVAGMSFGERVHLAARAHPPLRPQEHSLTLSVLGGARPLAPPGLVARATTRIRTAFREACAGLPPDAAGLLLGLAVGDESLVTPQLDEAMVRAGLAHLTAVSGSNTALVAGLALAAATWLGLGWRSRVASSALVLAGYVVLVRPQPSVLRAAAMGAVALLALTAGGRRRGPPALLAATLCLLVAVPSFAVSVGFALSVAATAGLLLGGPPIVARLARWPVTAWIPDPVRAALAVALAAHLATLPLAVMLGNGASLVALPANVVVTPLVPVATVLGLAAALVAPVLPAVAHLLAMLAVPATASIAAVAHRAAGTPHGVVALPAGAGAAVATALVLAAGLLLGARSTWRDRRVQVAGAVLVAVAIGTTLVRDARWPPPGWAVLACDVGQGDAIVLRRPGSTQALLVDVGPDGARTSDCLADAGVREVVVLLTHFHADHIDGLAAVLGRWPVAIVLSSPVPEPSTGAAEVLEQTQRAGVPLRVLRGGDHLTAAGIPLEVLWPRRRLAQSPANNASVVAVARIPTQAGPLGVLLAGDIEPEAQVAIMAGPPPDVSVVKVPHHGSRHQVPGFAAWAGGSVALVCVGQGNDYGHPSPATLDQYRGAGAVVGRTDEQGALAVVPQRAGPALQVQR